MSTITLNGQIVVSGSILIPPVGAWVADVVMAATGDVSSPCTLVVGDLTLIGTVYRSASFAGSKSARIIGGAGGWRKTIPKRGYSHDAGVLASTVLIDAARESGETIVVDSDRQLGSSWAREDGAKAERTLHLVTGGQWWIDPAGVTQTKARDTSLITTPFTAVAWSGGKGSFEIASEFISDWQPGRTFTAPNITGTQAVSTVRVEATNEGKLRLLVLSTSSELDRATASLRYLIRSELAAVRYSAVWDYSVAPSLGLVGIVTTVDLTSSDPSMPDLTNVPLAPGLVESAPLAGTKCRVRFVNADPARPEIVSMSAKTEHVMTTEACALLIYNTLSLLMTLAGGGPLLAVVLQPLLGTAVATALTTPVGPAGLVAQTAAQAAATGLMAAGTPSPAISALFTASIATNLAAKFPDVTGFCPGVGIPNGT